MPGEVIDAIATNMPIRDVSLYVRAFGQGPPLALLHGGPGADHSTLLDLSPLADEFTLVFYDHRCNGRSEGAEVTTMTWENLTADADALRQALGFDRWALLGHSFGGMVALEYALRYPQHLSHLLLVDTTGDASWAREKAPQMLARRGFSPAQVETARRFFTGELAPDEMLPAMLKFAKAYTYRTRLWHMPRTLLAGMRVKVRPEAQIFAFKTLLKDWSVMARLGEIKTPTLVLAGRHDFQFPPEHQAILADRLPDARLELIELAGHNAPSERPAEVIRAVRRFLGAEHPGS